MRSASFAIGLATLLLWQCSPDTGAFTAPTSTGGAKAPAGSLATAGSGPATSGAAAPPAAGSGMSMLPPRAGSFASAGNSSASAGMGSAGRRGMMSMPAAGSGMSMNTAGSMVAQAGAGGSSGCVQNLTCKLDAPPSTGDYKQDCVDRINQFRTQCACLPALARWTDGEACADMMAMYDSGGTTAHAGFMARICSGGNAQNECPGWQSESQVVSGCLQSMWNEGPPPTNPCDSACFQKYGHFINMTNTKLKKVACGFYKTDAGKLWSVQNFSP
jgi:hypothetical protein